MSNAFDNHNNRKSVKKIRRALILVTLITTLLMGYQAWRKFDSSSQNGHQPGQAAAGDEIFDVRPGGNMQQVDAQEIDGGWLYTFTNGGLPASDPHVAKRLIVIEVEGASQPQRLKTLFPEACYELEYAHGLERGYPTWVDILVCPRYRESLDGLLVINKAMQGSAKFYGATLYIRIPALESRVGHYADIPMTSPELRLIDRFIEETCVYSLSKE